VPRYLITYQGGGEMDPSQNDKVKAAFGKWLAEAGQAVLDPGAPTNPVAHVSTGRSSRRSFAATRSWRRPRPTR